MSEITIQPPSSASFSRRSSPSSSPAQGQGSRRASPSYRSHMAFATSAASYPSQSPSPPVESSNIFGQMPTQRRTEEEILPSEPSPPPSYQLQGRCTRPVECGLINHVPSGLSVTSRTLQRSSQCRNNNTFDFSLKLQFAHMCKIMFAACLKLVLVMLELMLS